jgi:hypothetical protein
MKIGGELMIFCRIGIIPTLPGGDSLQMVMGVHLNRQKWNWLSH